MKKKVKTKLKRSQANSKKKKLKRKPTYKFKNDTHKYPETNIVTRRTFMDNERTILERAHSNPKKTKTERG